MKLTQKIYNSTEKQTAFYSNNHPKIDFYLDGIYIGSTNYYKTVRQALKGKADSIGLNIGSFESLEAKKDQ